MKLIFWNIMGNEISNSLNEIITKEEPKILILAESQNINEQFLIENKFKKISEITILRTKQTLKIFSLQNINIYKIEENSIQRYSANILENNKIKLLIIAVHLPSKLYGDNHQKITTLLNIIVEKINYLKERHNLDKVLITGDFNINPYEAPLNGILKSTNCPECSKIIKEYNVDKEAYYNPNFHLLGNLNNKFYGTYFFEKNWHVLDQVFINGELVKYFDIENFNIVSVKEAIINGKPNKKISDHLPIKFTLKI